MRNVGPAKPRGWRGNCWAPGGLYLKPRTMEMFEHRGDSLPGNRDQRYVRVPLPAAFAVGPLLGLAYVMALPFIGVGWGAYLAGRWLWRAGRGVPLLFLAAVWVPGRLFLLRGIVGLRNGKEDKGWKSAERPKEKRP